MYYNIVSRDIVLFIVYYNKAVYYKKIRIYKVIKNIM